MVPPRDRKYTSGDHKGDDKGCLLYTSSLESIFVFLRALRTLISDSPSMQAISSAIVFSINRDWAPVAPTLPISSLSTRKQQFVYWQDSTSKIAARDV